SPSPQWRQCFAQPQKATFITSQGRQRLAEHVCARAISSHAPTIIAVLISRIALRDASTDRRCIMVILDVNQLQSEEQSEANAASLLGCLRTLPPLGKTPRSKQN